MIRIVILLVGATISALSIIFGFSLVESFTDPVFSLVLIGLLTGIVSIFSQQSLDPERQKANKNKASPINSQALMAAASMAVIIGVVIFLYFSYVQAPGK